MTHSEIFLIRDFLKDLENYRNAPTKAQKEVSHRGIFEKNHQSFWGKNCTGSIFSKIAGLGLQNYCFRIPLELFF